MLSEAEKKLVSSGKRKGHDHDEAQSVEESKRARAGIEATAQGKDNRLLAGFLAHAFLSRGTLLGRRWAPFDGSHRRRGACPWRGTRARESRPAAYCPSPGAWPQSRPELAWIPSKGAFEQGLLPPASGAYSQASYLLLKAEGTHIPGVVNPTQLARWLQM
ncbi:uncharacterized protein LOC141812713 [Curcuma longa]|uniref:uncharacterized protein LOC141812713 n=1 Tax=Curcuma longa TaxID=136217 RepID=UPI003D9F05EF